jgi:glycosyltransferase involved in cell wall biosynthesis
VSRVAVIIPALNESGNIRQLVHDVRSTVTADVVVVDNGSTDSTAQEARQAGAKVVGEPRRGYGYACAAGVAETDRFFWMVIAVSRLLSFQRCSRRSVKIAQI